ncbi:MAG: CopK family periplasmic copper-binding protein [Gammaproteobacteria bacterium]|jgi:hypothetical protein|nr:CopK family periplasmic copper-binding protein [Gammaproteobacteria bacterium]
MKKTLLTVALTLAVCGVSHATEGVATEVALKDGSTLYLHADGTGRMVDAHGKKMEMKDGTQMETADGGLILMLNRKIWVPWGKPGAGNAVIKND